MNRVTSFILRSLVGITALTGAIGAGAQASARPYDDGCLGTPVPYLGPAQIQWGGSWWAGSVLASNNGQYLVHYDGWSSSWDEWVGPERVQLTMPAPVPVPQPVYVPVRPYGQEPAPSYRHDSRGRGSDRGGRNDRGHRQHGR